MAFLKVRLCSVLFSWGGGKKCTHTHTLMANEVHKTAVCCGWERPQCNVVSWKASMCRASGMNPWGLADCRHSALLGRSWRQGIYADSPALTREQKTPWSCKSQAQVPPEHSTADLGSEGGHSLSWPTTWSEETCRIQPYTDEWEWNPKNKTQKQWPISSYWLFL